MPVSAPWSPPPSHCSCYSEHCSQKIVYQNYDCLREMVWQHCHSSLWRGSEVVCSSHTLSVSCQHHVIIMDNGVRKVYSRRWCSILSRYRKDSKNVLGKCTGHNYSVWVYTMVLFQLTPVWHRHLFVSFFCSSHKLLDQTLVLQPPHWGRVYALSSSPLTQQRHAVLSSETSPQNHAVSFFQWRWSVSSCWSCCGYQGSSSGRV